MLSYLLPAPAGERAGIRASNGNPGTREVMSLLHADNEAGQVRQGLSIIMSTHSDLRTHHLVRAEPGQVLDTQVWHGPALTVISVLQNKHGSYHKMLQRYQRMGANLQTAGRSHGAPPPEASPDSPRPLHLSAGTLARPGCRDPSWPSTAAARFCASDNSQLSPVPAPDESSPLVPDIKVVQGLGEPQGLRLWLRAACERRPQPEAPTHPQQGDHKEARGQRHPVSKS